jgi:hypothetical protein
LHLIIVISATINFGSSTTQMAVYTQVKSCPTMRHTYQYSGTRPSFTLSHSSAAQCGALT